jgi:ATP-binding cassette subfamily F protein uup
VHGDLEDFLFPRERARSPVKALSGGERNRLLLARLLTRPANVLVFDEPTNDLDLETLELVEAQLAEFPGTILLVSHDRVFLDHVVTSTMAFEGDGRVVEYVGGYEDWLRQRPVPTASTSTSVPTNSKMPVSSKIQQKVPPDFSPAAVPRKKLSYKEKREFDALPEKIAALEAEDVRLQAAIAHSDFYKEGAEAIKTTLARVETLRDELHAAYARWDELDSRS